MWMATNECKEYGDHWRRKAAPRSPENSTPSLDAKLCALENVVCLPAAKKFSKSAGKWCQKCIEYDNRIELERTQKSRSGDGDTYRYVTLHLNWTMPAGAKTLMCLKCKEYGDYWRRFAAPRSPEKSSPLLDTKVSALKNAVCLPAAKRNAFDTVVNREAQRNVEAQRSQFDAVYYAGFVALPRYLAKFGLRQRLMSIELAKRLGCWIGNSACFCGYNPGTLPTQLLIQVDLNPPFKLRGVPTQIDGASISSSSQVLTIFRRSALLLAYQSLGDRNHGCLNPVCYYVRLIRPPPRISLLGRTQLRLFESSGYYYVRLNPVIPHSTHTYILELDEPWFTVLGLQLQLALIFNFSTSLRPYLGLIILDLFFNISSSSYAGLTGDSTGNAQVDRVQYFGSHTQLNLTLLFLDRNANQVSEFFGRRQAHTVFSSATLRSYLCPASGILALNIQHPTHPSSKTTPPAVIFRVSGAAFELSRAPSPRRDAPCASKYVHARN
ncbi:hypothetical protein C8F04DRAFT_1291084 [Mycena alexandri]|uniref:Uncharacterized protein n=1 Tax=Mycena alexandri TaxID=1745969 RepID=A0AAD6SI56_9AGAR|nr:hypothetical protein C8F04DRAFT_1291084 [Mycena alexandri]